MERKAVVTIHAASESILKRILEKVKAIEKEEVEAQFQYFTEG